MVTAFVKNPELPPTNNDAERALRHAVISRRISFGTRTTEGSQAYAALLSVIETCRLRTVSLVNSANFLLFCHSILTTMNRIQEKEMNSKPLKILIADDNKPNIDTFTEYLKSKFYDVFGAYDGLEHLIWHVKKSRI